MPGKCGILPYGDAAELPGVTPRFLNQGLYSVKAVGAAYSEQRVSICDLGLPRQRSRRPVSTFYMLFECDIATFL
jgi:hypothetical protein